MGTSSRKGNLPGISIRFNIRATVSIAMSILLCAGIVGCVGTGTFALSSPLNGTRYVWLTPTLTWTDAARETSYTVEIDDENTFSPPLVHQSTGIAANSTSLVVPDGVLASGTKYYWRVIAENSASPAVASNAPFAFTVTVLSSGALVHGFGANGVVTSDPSTTTDGAFGIAVDSTAIYVVGFDASPGLSDWQWRIEKRSLADGSLVPGFGAGGAVTSNPSSGYDGAYHITIDSAAMYVVGYDSSPGNEEWRIEKRSLTDGGLVPGFGAGGIVTSNPSEGHDAIHGIAIDSTAMYLVGYDESTGDLNPEWRIEKRSLTDGSLIQGFGTGGVVTGNYSAGYDGASGIAIDSAAMYVVGYDSSPGNSQWRIEKRSLTDGNLVPGFGAGGVVTSDPTAGDDAASNIVIDSAAMYVVGYDDETPEEWNPEWRIEKRSLTDGSLIPGFGTGGVVTSDPSTDWDAALGIAIDSAAMYVVGYDESPVMAWWQWRIEKRAK